MFEGISIMPFNILRRVNQMIQYYYITIDWAKLFKSYIIDFGFDQWILIINCGIFLDI